MILKINDYENNGCSPSRQTEIYFCIFLYSQTSMCQAAVHKRTRLLRLWQIQLHLWWLLLLLLSPPWGVYPSGDNLAAASDQGHNANLLANLHLQSPLEKNRPAMLRLRVRWRQKEKKEKQSKPCMSITWCFCLNSTTSGINNVWDIYI